MFCHHYNVDSCSRFPSELPKSPRAAVMSSVHSRRQFQQREWHICRYFEPFRRDENQPLYCLQVVCAGQCSLGKELLSQDEESWITQSGLCYVKAQFIWPQWYFPIPVSATLYNATERRQSTGSHSPLEKSFQLLEHIGIFTYFSCYSSIKLPLCQSHFGSSGRTI